MENTNSPTQVAKPNRRKGFRFKRELAWAMSFLATSATVGWAFTNWVIADRDEFSARIAINAACCEAFESYRAEDSAQRNYWVGEITSNSSSISELELQSAVTEQSVLSQTQRLDDKAEYIIRSLKTVSDRIGNLAEAAKANADAITAIGYQLQQHQGQIDDLQKR